MSSPPDDERTLIDCVHAARLVAEFSAGASFERFESEQALQAAVLFQLAILGESVKQLTSDFRDSHQDVEWRQIAGLRDVILHRYQRLRLDEIWEVVTVRLPYLIAYLEDALKEFPGDPDAQP